MAKARTYKDIIELRDKMQSIQRNLDDTETSSKHVQSQAYHQNHHIATLLMELYSNGNKYPSRMCTQQH